MFSGHRIPPRLSQVERLREAELHLRSRWHRKRPNRNSGAHLSCCPRLCLQLKSTIRFDWYGLAPDRNGSEIYAKRVRPTRICLRCLNFGQDLGSGRKQGLPLHGHVLIKLGHDRCAHAIARRDRGPSSHNESRPCGDSRGGQKWRREPHAH